MLKRQLDALDGQGLIRQVKPDPELEYLFKHALVQEAAYESLLKTARGDLHRRVAEAIESLESLDPDPAVLAMHYARAGLLPKALTYSVQAGDRARRIYANREALMHYDVALTAAGQMDANDAQVNQTMAEVYANRGRVMEVAGDSASAIANYQDMMAFAERSGNPIVRVEAMNRLNTIRIVSRGANTVSESDLDEAHNLANATGDPWLIGQALWTYGLYYRFYDPFAAEAYLQRSRTVALSAPSPDERLLDLAANAALDSMIAMIVCGKLRKALEYGFRAMDEYRALNNQQFLADAIGGVSLIQYFQGAGPAARALSEEGVRISQAIDNPWGVIYNEWRLAEMEIDRGDYSRVIGQLASRRAVARSLGFPIFIGMVLSQAARAYLDQGRPDLALPLCDESADAFESMQQASWTLWGKGIRALPRLRLGDLAGARQLLESLWREGERYTMGFQGFMETGPVIAEWALADGRIGYGLRFCDWLLPQFEAEDALRLAGEMRYWRGRLRWVANQADGAVADLMQARDWLIRCDARTLLAKVDEALAQVGQ
jgi:hypothetical protein